MRDTPPELQAPLVMDNPIQAYAWGSTRALARLQRRVPGDRKEAELWMGAHPTAPSRVEVEGRAMPLDELIARWPEATLGGPGPLPFLLKVLAVAAPLSIQAHPDAAQAAAGFAREEALGLPAGRRSYRDPHAKPELVVALTAFEALCGFRPAAEARALLQAAGLPWTERRAAVAGLLDPQASALVRPALRALEARDPALAALCRRLDEAHPGDPGVLFPLLLRHLVLQPGQGLFLPPGHLHCYLEGVAVEIMGNSDNVLRGGLTGKHKDPAELMAILDWEAPPSPVLDPDPTGAYPAPTAAFRLRIADSPVRGPAIVLCTGGALYLKTQRIISGDSAFIPAAAGPVPLGGNGVGFIATGG